MDSDTYVVKNNVLILQNEEALSHLVSYKY
jgi:hypothetical protein